MGALVWNGQANGATGVPPRDVAPQPETPGVETPRHYSVVMRWAFGMHGAGSPVTVWSGTTTLAEAKKIAQTFKSPAVDKAPSANGKWCLFAAVLAPGTHNVLYVWTRGCILNPHGQSIWPCAPGMYLASDGKCYSYGRSVPSPYPPNLIRWDLRGVPGKLEWLGGAW